MDVFAHTLWTNAGARGVNKLARKKGKKLRLHVGWTAFWGVIPDFFAFTIPFIAALRAVIFENASFWGARSGLFGGFDLAAYLYQYSHSLVIFAMAFVLVWIIRKRPTYEMLGWALHILIDIPSHSINFYATPFLFPISDYRFPYGVSWSNMWFMIVNYSALAVTWVAIFLKRNKKPPQ